MAALGLGLEPVVQRHGNGRDAAGAQVAAQRGVSGEAGALPHGEAIQRSFGRHQIGDVRAHLGGPASEACEQIGADAYATGRDVAFATTPDLRTAAHEAAHVVQQRAGVQLKGGFGEVGDPYEQHADRVADLVVRGESAERALDEQPGGGGGGAGAVVQRDTNRDRTERAQDWDPTLAGPIDAEAASTADADVAAIQETIGLQITDDKIRRLRSFLGLATPRRAGAPIDRALVRAVRARQGGSGVLSKDVVFALNLGATWPGLDAAPAYYRRTPPWSGFDQAALLAVRAAIAPELEIGAADLDGPPVVVSATFVQHVVNWQFWARRSAATVAWGRLDTEALRELGADLPTTTATAGELAASEAPEVEDASSEPDSEDDDLALDEDDSEDGFTPEQRAQLSQIETRLRQLRRSAPAAAASAEIDQMWRAVVQVGIYNDWVRAAESARPHMKARWLVDGIRAALGHPVPPLPGRSGRAARPGPASDRAGSVPALERRDADESRRHLEETGVVVDRDAEGHLEERELRRGERGWERRVLPGNAGNTSPAEEVTVAAAAIVPELQRVKAEMLAWKARLDDAYATPANIGPTLDALRGAQPFRIPRTLRSPWRPTLPRPLAASQWASVSLARQTDRTWSRALRAAANEAQKKIVLHQRYQRSPLRVTRDAVRADFNRTGVRVTNNRGRQLGPDEMHLQVQFADAMLRFLEMIRGLGATEMWTAGFLREPISPDDSHPQGRACDITGFRFGETLLHLRNGRAGPPGAAAGAEPTFSDWYNHRDHLGALSYSQILHTVTARMASYFSLIVGPGHDSSHAGHWHVELAASAPRGARIHAVQAGDAPEQEHDEEAAPPDPG